MPFFTVIPNISSASGLPTIDTNLVTDMLGNPARLDEVDATGFWLFGDSIASLTDSSGRVLVPQGSSPTYSAGYMTINTGQGNDLISNINTEKDYSVAMVFQSTTGASPRILHGDLPTTAANGLSSFATDFSITMNGRPDSGQLQVSAPHVNARWYFLQISYNETTKEAILYVGGFTPVTDSNYDVDKLAGAVATLGNSSFVGAGAVDMPVAEFIVYNESRTLDQMSDLFGRVKVRQLERGNVVYDI
jgi:hypothetical protein